jgi:hypothetical protein
MKNTFKNFEEYFLTFPEETQQKLEQLRKFIHSLIPDLEEYIGYQMPAFKHNEKPLVYFAGYKIISDFIRFPKQLFILKMILRKENINFQKVRFSFR